MADSYIILFFIFSILGYISEVIYCSIPQHRFVNRGFLYGPYLPIYGSGAMIVLVLLEPFRSNPVLIFIFGLVLTSMLEYFTSWALEKLFSVKLWDYSKHRVNINGRVCMLNSTLFGIMGLVLVYVVYPPLSDFIARIPRIIQHYTAYLIVIAMSIDATLSVMKMNAFKRGLERIRATRKDIESRVIALEGEGKAELARELRARLEASVSRSVEEFRERSKHIMLANPTITARSKELQSDIEILSEWVRERRELRRKYRADAKASDQRHLERIRNGK